MEKAKEEIRKPLDYTNLEKKLDELDAVAFQNAERACRMAGDPASDIIYSGNFRARLAAQALGVPYDDIRRADLRTYSAIIERTLNFLLQPLGEMVLRQNN